MKGIPYGREREGQAIFGGKKSKGAELRKWHGRREKCGDRDVRVRSDVEDKEPCVRTEEERVSTTEKLMESCVEQ